MKQIKVSDNVYEDIKSLAENKGMSMNQFVQYLLELYKSGGSEDKPLKKIIEKEDFPIMYPTRCKECKKELKPGDRVYYVKYIYEDGTSRTYITCMDCYLKGKAKSLAKIYRKRRELEVVISQLKKEANVLADKVNRLESMYDIALECEKIYKDLQRFYRDFVNTAIDSIGSDVRDKIIQGLEELMSISQKLSVIEKQLSKLIEDTLKSSHKSKEKVVEYGYVRQGS